MDNFKYSHTLESFLESGDLAENYMYINWKMVMSEVIVAHNTRKLDIPLYRLLNAIKEDVLAYCGNPEELKLLLENIQ